VKVSKGRRRIVGAPAISEARQGAPGPENEKYQRILEAAVEVIAENGYFNSPVSAIASRAGVADGTVYLYFKSKDDLLRTAIDTTLGRFYAVVEERFQTMHDPREQLEFIAQTHLESSTRNRSMAILMQTEMRQSAKFVEEFSHKHLVRYIQVVREVVRRGQQSGVFRQDVSDGVVAHCMFGAIDELLSSAVFTGRTYDAKATAKQVLDVMLNGIGASDEDAEEERSSAAAGNGLG
jgi:TetR/AcrR family fatty acid metabolism transcriptional regulator